VSRARLTLVLAAAALLVLGCSSQPPQPEQELAAERSPPPAPPVEAVPQKPSPPPAPTPVAKPPPEPAGTGLLDAAKLPPFEGERRTVQEPLRGLATIDRTVPPDDLWQRIRRGFAMPDLDGKLVHDKMAYYVARPDYMQRIFDRSRLYLYHIVEELEKRNLPTELALLPMVESAFNPMAYSRAHASGLWQFIPGTGKRYELSQNWWYDGRRDIVDSTSAALEYLTRLYELHGDWHLALASYNWGEGAVARAIAKNRKAGKPTDYASLAMPAETRHYIPKLQALKNIITNPEPFGIELDPIPNQPYFVSITRLRDIDVQLAARLAEMPVEEFIALNPGFSRPLIRAALTPRIVLPADKVDVFHDNLTKLADKSLVSWKSYHPTRGDTLESIAKKHGITLGQLKEVNGISPRNRAVPSLLVVPMQGSAATSMRKMPIMYAPPIPVAVRRLFHTVRSGESAATIARRYGVDAEDLKRWNPGVRLAPGKKIMVEVRAPAKRKKAGKRKVAKRRS
jgi:membrane-bound lytic murein transglycosylase D